jgi:hypothetical protein
MPVQLAQSAGLETDQGCRDLAEHKQELGAVAVQSLDGMRMAAGKTLDFLLLRSGFRTKRPRSIEVSIL